jgi:molybdopterin synthase catalytic subunit
MNFRLSLEPIDPSALQAALRDARAGACATFEGWVRVRNEGREVQALDYEAYRPLAEKEGARILDEARARFGFIAAVCVHRLGPLVPGDLAIWVGVTAEHRGAAFEACRAIVDEVKARVPIWKREHYSGGAADWINAADAGAAGSSPGPTPPVRA